jgi:hypothetical protein
VLKSLAPDSPLLVDRKLREAVVNPKTGKAIAKAGVRVNAKLAAKIAKLDIGEVLVVPFATTDVEYLSADVEDNRRKKEEK